VYALKKEHFYFGASFTKVFEQIFQKPEDSLKYFLTFFENFKAFQRLTMNKHKRIFFSRVLTQLLNPWATIMMYSGDERLIFTLSLEAILSGSSLKSGIQEDEWSLESISVI
jgi:hypothetical protein